jgi:hypothetical protein
MQSFDQRNLPSIKEMIIAGGRLDNTFAMREYEISNYDGKAYNLFTKTVAKSDWNKDKGNSFIDFYTKKKAFVPSPNHYKNVNEGHEAQVAKVSTPALYKTPRKTEFM